MTVRSRRARLVAVLVHAPLDDLAHFVLEVRPVDQELGPLPGSEEAGQLVLIAPPEVVLTDAQLIVFREQPREVGVGGGALAQRRTHAAAQLTRRAHQLTPTRTALGQHAFDVTALRRIELQLAREIADELLHDLDLERITPRLFGGAARRIRRPARAALLLLRVRERRHEHEEQESENSAFHESSSARSSSSSSTERSCRSEEPCSSGSSAAAQLTDDASVASSVTTAGAGSGDWNTPARCSTRLPPSTAAATVAAAARRDGSHRRRDTGRRTASSTRASSPAGTGVRAE